MILSYQREDNKVLKTYTCRLDQRPFASETAITESSACFSNEDQDAYLFASMCAEHGKFVFKKGKDFICDLSLGSCSEESCQIYVNADCVAGSTSYGDACDQVKAIWNKHKNEQSKSVKFVEQMRSDYSSCQYANSELTCNATKTNDDDM